MIKKKFLCIIIILTMLITIILPYKEIFASNTYTQYVTSGISSFPEEYQTLLNQLVEETGHTNWTFKAYYTGIDWEDYVSGESPCGKNRIYSSFDTAYRCVCGDCASSYYCASSAITEYYMDPTNFINERNIFQFLEMSYDSSIQTASIVQSYISKYEVFNYGNAITFTMSDENHPSYGQQVTMTYTDIIMEAASQSQMSPISIAIKIVQEVGSSGSESVSGTNSTYPNTYNYFNIGAYDTGDAILNGLSYASSKGWNCPYTSIVEGSIYNSTNYVQAGQNTAYFYKFDCVGSSILNVGESQTVTDSELYSHQYMTNILDPYSQSASLFSTYTNEGLLNESLCFVIPVFENMPETVSKPSSLSNSSGELYYANISSTASIRATPTTSGEFIDYIYKDDLVVMLERNCATANGYSWDKVQIWNGQIAYIASIFLEPYDKTTSSGGSTDSNTDTDTNLDSGTSSDGKVQENIGYGYANVSSTLNVRAGAGTTYSILTSLSSKEEAVIISETTSWYKVKTNSGIIGYVSKEYFTQLNYYSISDTTITLIPNINADVIAGVLGVDSYTITKDDVVQDGITVGTGYKLIANDIEYTIVKKGDATGDGKVSSADLLSVQKYLLEIIEYTNDYTFRGADVTGEGTISSSDLLAIQKSLLGISNIQI